MFTKGLSKEFFDFRPPPFRGYYVTLLHDRAYRPKVVCRSVTSGMYELSTQSSFGSLDSRGFERGYVLLF